MGRAPRSGRDVRRSDVRLFRGIGTFVAVAGTVATIYSVIAIAGREEGFGDLGGGWAVLASGPVVVLLGLILAALGTLIAAVDDE